MDSLGDQESVGRIAKPHAGAIPKAAARSSGNASLPEPLIKKLPRYPSVPVARLGQLAIDKAHQGRKLGNALLWDAGMRTLRSEIAAFALVVDARDERAEGFHRHLGFIALSDQPRRVVLPLATFLRA